MRTSTCRILAATIIAIAFVSPLSAAASASPSPGGVRTVSFRGVSVRVPASWPVYDLTHEPTRCARLDVHAVYLGHEGPNAKCPAHLVGKTDTAQLEPLDDVVANAAARATQNRALNGQAVRVDPSDGTTHDIRAAAAAAGVLLSVSYGSNRTEADRVLDTLAVVPEPVTHLPATHAPTPHPTATRATPRPTPRRPTPRPTATPAPPPAPTPAPVPPPGEPTGPFVGFGFDTCTAPSTAATQAWLASPFRAIGIYIGGANRACTDGNLSPAWVSAVQAQGWSLIPIYVGLQAPCAGSFATIDPPRAAQEGAQAAYDASVRANYLGLGQGTAVYFDMEAYNPVGGSCSSAVTTFLSAWSDEIHNAGHLSGVYGNVSSAIQDLASSAGTRPEQIWFAYWDGGGGVGHPAIPADLWAGHQRIKQFAGGDNRTYNGVTLNVDSNTINATLRAAPPPPPPTPTPAPPPTPTPRHSPTPSPHRSPTPRPSH